MIETSRGGNAKVLVYGATGWTGRLVTEAIARRGVGVVAAGRRREALDELARAHPAIEPRVVVAPRAEAWRRAFADVRVVVNCAGPSIDGALAVVDAAIDAGVHYLDVSGEKLFVHRVYSTRDARAHARGVVVGPAFAGKGALGDWGAAVGVRRLGAAGARPHVAIAYAHTSEGFVRPSAGSALSAAGQGFVRPRDRTLAPLRRTFPFPPPFGRGSALRVPGAEDVSIARHTPVSEVATYVSIDPGRPLNALWTSAIAAAIPIMPLIADLLQSEASRRALVRMPEPVSDGAPSFAASIEIASALARCSLAILAADAYSVTAEIVAYGAERLLGLPRAEGGVLAPSQIVEPSRALRDLQAHGAMVVLERAAERTLQR